MSLALVFTYLVSMPCLLFIAAIYRMNTAILRRQYHLIILPTFLFFMTSAWMAKSLLMLGDEALILATFERFKLFSVVTFFVLLVLNELPFLFRLRRKGQPPNSTPRS